MSRKVMVCGDVGGNLADLFKRVETVQKKNGVFDMLICAGEVGPCALCTRTRGVARDSFQGSGVLARPGPEIGFKRQGEV